MFFLELSCFFHDPVDVVNLISGSSAFSKTSLNVREFMVHVLLKPGLENYLNKTSGSDGIPAEVFKILKNYAVKMLHSEFQDIWKTHQWPQNS